jgi:alkylated DNA repair dioxygenase AlkB
LFDSAAEPHTLIDAVGSRVWLWRAWLPREQADQALGALTRQVQPRSAQIQIFGKQQTIPRLQAWHGEPGAAYRYSGVWMQPEPWTPVLRELRDRLATLPGEPRFNSVLVNLYRDGSDCVGWHGDDERELGHEPQIASLSFGATRRFHIKPKARPGSASAQRLAELGPLQIDLEHGDLLVMEGQTQRHFVHAAPRTRRAVDARWNLTYRRVQPTRDEASAQV